MSSFEAPRAALPSFNERQVVMPMAPLEAIRAIISPEDLEKDLLEILKSWNPEDLEKDLALTLILILNPNPQPWTY